MPFVTKSILLNLNNETEADVAINIAPVVKSITAVGAFCDTGATNNYFIRSSLVDGEIVGLYDGTNQMLQKLDLDYDYSKNIRSVGGSYNFKFVDFANANIALTGGIVMIFKFHY